MIKKLLIIGLIVLPMAASAAIQVPPAQTPLQPAPEGIGPNINSNINSGESSFNESQQQIQDQLPAGDNEEESPIVAPVVVSTQSIAFYWALIIICALAMLGMFAYLYYRYRTKE